MKARYRKSLRACELPAEWRAAGHFAPDEQVTVTITPDSQDTGTPDSQDTGGSPKRFIGAGKGLFASAREVDTYLRRSRNAWRS